MTPGDELKIFAEFFVRMVKLTGLIVGDQQIVLTMVAKGAAARPCFFFVNLAVTADDQNIPMQPQNALGETVFPVLEQVSASFGCDQARPDLQHCIALDHKAIGSEMMVGERMK